MSKLDGIKLGYVRVYAPKSGDQIYFNVVAVKQLGYDYELSIGEDIYLMELPAKVIEKKYIRNTQIRSGGSFGLNKKNILMDIFY